MTTTPAERLMRLAPLPLRIGLGIIMIVHGQPKVYGEARERLPGAVESLNVPAPATVAKVVSNLELFGGLALIAGLFTRPIALLFSVQFLFILLKMKFARGFSDFEFDLALLAGFLSLLFMGGGAGSLDEVLFGEDRPRSRWAWRPASSQRWLR